MPTDLDTAAHRPHELETPEELASLVRTSSIPRYFGDNPLATFVFDSQRRIVYANRKARDLVGEGRPSLIGASLGSALGCVHAHEAPQSCASGAACRFCPAFRSLGVALRAIEDLGGPTFTEGGELWIAPGEGEDCNIARGNDDYDIGETSIDLRIWARPILVAGRGLVILSAMDISAEKRREVLERVFYHDIANTASGMRTILELLKVLDDGEREHHLGLLKSAADQLIEEIESQRALKAAESRELAPSFGILDGKLALEEVLNHFAYKLEGKDIRLELAPGTGHLAVHSDPILLRRVIINMIKNAIEAAVRGEILLVGLQAEGEASTVPPPEAPSPGWAVFWVKNSAVMPEVARRRVFHRSFSTKGPGRGVGTYSMKLLAEGYLRGRVSFTSREGEGTIFELRIPQA